MGKSTTNPTAELRVLAFDPGETTGMACFYKGQVFCNVFGLWAWVPLYMNKVRPTVVVIEDFRLRLHAARSLVGSDFPTCQVIGVIKYLAERAKVPVVMQSPSILAGMKDRVVVPEDSKHLITGEHMLDALKHGLYYLESQEALEPYERWLQD